MKVDLEVNGLGNLSLMVYEKLYGCVDLKGKNPCYVYLIYLYFVLG